MGNALLAQLRADHTRFERLFRALEDQCVRMEAGLPADLKRIRAIAEYLEDFALPAHHALEDAIYAQLSVRLPQFQHDVLDLAEDHHVSKLEFRNFVREVERNGAHLTEAARSFVANERAHFISEEEVIFAYAEKYLTADQWRTLVESGLADIPNGFAPTSEEICDLLA